MTTIVMSIAFTLFWDKCIYIFFFYVMLALVSRQTDIRSIVAFTSYMIIWDFNSGLRVGIKLD